jgi:hypothetical protein
MDVAAVDAASMVIIARLILCLNVLPDPGLKALEDHQARGLIRGPLRLRQQAKVFHLKLPKAAVLKGAQLPVLEAHQSRSLSHRRWRSSSEALPGLRLTSIGPCVR